MYERSIKLLSIYKKYTPLILITAFLITMIPFKLKKIGFLFPFNALWESYLILVAIWLIAVIVLAITTYYRSSEWKNFVLDDFTVVQKAFMTKCFLKQAAYLSFRPILYITITVSTCTMLMSRVSIRDFIEAPSYLLILVLCMAVSLTAFGQLGCYIVKAALYMQPWHLYGKYYDYPDGYVEPEEQKVQ